MHTRYTIVVGIDDTYYEMKKIHLQLSIKPKVLWGKRKKSGFLFALASLSH